MYNYILAIFSYFFKLDFCKRNNAKIIVFIIFLCFLNKYIYSYIYIYIYE